MVNDSGSTSDFLNPDDESARSNTSDVIIWYDSLDAPNVFLDTMEYCKECGAELGWAHQVHGENKHLPTCSRAPWELRVEYRLAELERRIEALTSAAEARDGDG